MGGGSSKDAQLQKLGQLFSTQERQCLNKTFHTIAGYEEATFFSKDELQVSQCAEGLSQPAREKWWSGWNVLKRGPLQVNWCGV